MKTRSSKKEKGGGGEKGEEKRKKRRRKHRNMGEQATEGRLIFKDVAVTSDNL